MGSKGLLAFFVRFDEIPNKGRRFLQGEAEHVGELLVQLALRLLEDGLLGGVQLLVLR